MVETAAADVLWVPVNEDGTIEAPETYAQFPGKIADALNALGEGKSLRFMLSSKPHLRQCAGQERGTPDRSHHWRDAESAYEHGV